MPVVTEPPQEPHAAAHSVAATFTQAVLAYQGRQFGDAERLCVAVLDTEPDHFDALCLLGVILYGRGRRNEALASYDRALAIRPDDAETLSNRGHVLKDFKRIGEALESYDKAVQSDPDFADAHYNRAILLRGLKRYEEALGAYDHVLALRPEHPEALNNRGNVLGQLGRFSEALASYDRALAIRPDYAEALNNRGVVLQEIKHFEDALASYDQAVALRPDYAEAFNNRGGVLKELRRFEEAFASYQKAQELAPDDADAHWNEAVLRLLTGDLVAGWPKYEWRWKRETFTSLRRDFPQPLWDGFESLYDKTILLHAEQGHGDAIQFCRYVPQVAARGARVILEVAAPLRQLMASLPGVAQIVVAGEPLPAFDTHCPLLSLPHAFGTKLGTIPAATPYLRAPAEALPTWEALLDTMNGSRIGIAWAGNPAHDNDRDRSIGLGAMLPLLDIDATFVSLQKELRPGDEALLRDRADIVHLGDLLNDLTDMAALVMNLDLVITADTSLAHLAGALGKPVWILLPFMPDWRWLLDRDTSPWYPSARLFRQPRPEDWDEVIARVKAALPNAVGGIAAGDDRPDDPTPDPA